MPRKRSTALMTPATERPRLTWDGREQIQQRIDEITRVRLPELRPLLAERERDERDVAAFERLLAESLELQALLDRSEELPTVDPTNFDGRLALGMRALITVADGSSAWVRPVHPGEAHLDDERISMDSPLAVAILGSPIGASVTVDAPSNRWVCDILDIDPRAAREPDC